MSRYIDAIPLIEKWEKECGRGTNNGTCQGDCFDCQFPAAIDDLKDAPTVDAVPVEWIENYVKWLRKREIHFAPVAIETMLSYYKDSQPYCDSCGERRTDEQP